MNPYESPTHCEPMLPIDWYAWTLCAVGCSSLLGMISIAGYWLYVCRPGQPELGPSVLLPYCLVPVHLLGFAFMACLDRLSKHEENKPEKTL